MQHDFSRRYAVAGLGVVAGRFPEHTARSLQVEAARLAIEDAGLDRRAIEACIEVRVEGADEMRPASTDGFPRILGLPSKCLFSISRGGALVAYSCIAATQLLNLGIAKHVLVACSVTDWQRRERRAKGEKLPSMEKAGLWGKPYGDTSAVSHHSMFMSRHMHEFGTTPEHLGSVAVQQRRWANMNPEAALYRRPLTMEDYLAAPYVVEPYRAYDMCLISDAAAAFVLTTAERATDLQQPPVYLLGVGLGDHMERLWWEKANYTHLAVESAKQAAFEQAGITLQDVDIAQLYDCFTGEVILQVEDYGWCDKGEGGPFIAAGNTGPGGRIPMNTGGGLLGSYAMADFPLFTETVTQLRGHAGARQCPDVHVGLTSGHGGELLRPGMCSAHATVLWGN